MSKFKFTKTDIEGVVIVEPSVFGDARGYFMETYHEQEFKEAGLKLIINRNSKRHELMSHLFKTINRSLVKVFCVVCIFKHDIRKENWCV